MLVALVTVAAARDDRGNLRAVIFGLLGCGSPPARVAASPRLRADPCIIFRDVVKHGTRVIGAELHRLEESTG